MRIAALFCFALFASAIPAQDDVLAVERKDDLAGRAKAVTLLKKTRIPLIARDMSMKELTRLLTIATNDKLTFACSTRDSDEAAKMNLELRSASLWAIMAIAQRETGLRFVYRFGVVFVTKADRLKPLTYLRTYNLRAHVAPLRNFPGPDLRLRTADDERPLFPEPVETDQTISGFTADGIEQLITDNVTPDSWSDKGVTLINQDGLFLIRQTPAAHREIERLLTRVGLLARRTAVATKKPRTSKRKSAKAKRPAPSKKRARK